jgi:uncharacterized protein YicC (UPF0701 family)
VDCVQVKIIGFCEGQVNRGRISVRIQHHRKRSVPANLDLNEDFIVLINEWDLYHLIVAGKSDANATHAQSSGDH